ncbi:hypothetical protein A7A09_010545 [Paracoccus methylarcula]|uniref:Uncharacterized protein n=1 Tax=Paracoccus methylarcula TaxID=72022 RepID=A0A3R7Q2G7_9RHOB|nr:hypothetical protein A7A09_010545 [Paracoccus methylarcula]
MVFLPLVAMRDSPGSAEFDHDDEVSSQKASGPSIWLLERDRQVAGVTQVIGSSFRLDDLRAG